MARLEDGRFLTGRGRFTDDLSFAGAAQGYVLRSPHAHARIARLDAEAARRAPGVLAVLTGADLASDGIGRICCPVSIRAKDRSDYYDPPRPPLADGRVRHVGDPVAFVVAETLERARDAAELIEVDYEELPAVVDPAAARHAPPIWDDAPGNLCTLYERGDAAAVEAAFAAAADVVRLSTRNNRLVVNTIEPRAAVGEYDAASGRYTLTTPSQGVHILRDVLKDVLGVPPERLRVVTPDVGGGFGMKFQVYPEQALTLWAARRVGRPVRWRGDRSESFLSDTHARAHVTEGALALDADGRFIAYRIDTVADMGAYLSSFAPQIATLSYGKILTGMYDIQNVRFVSRLVFTNTVPVDAYRGAGKPEAHFLLERLVDLAADATGLDRAEIRRRNFVKPEQMPYRTQSKLVYDSGDFARILDVALRTADRDGFAARRRESESRGKLRGFGLSCYVHGTGGDPSEHGFVDVLPEGRAVARTGTQSQGQGHATAYAVIVARALGISPEEVEVVQGDTDLLPIGGGSGGSSSLILSGTSLTRASERVIEKGRALAGQLLEAAEADIEFADGSFRVAGTDRALHLYEVARRAAAPISGDARFDADYMCYPHGCQACEVEIEPETGRVEIVRYASADDFGEVITPKLLDGQVHGGILQGIGQALFEEAVYDGESGQLLAGSFMDYALPRAADAPAFTLAQAPTPTANNPLGAKGVGECGTIGAPACVINAVVDALKSRGVAHLDMPATPEKVWRALNRR
jgi:carbon-monoxide dehydrogenase large subunit